MNRASLRWTVVGALCLSSVASAQELVPSDRRTRWSPGIPGGVPRWTSVFRTIPAATYSVHGTNPAGAAAAINSALRAAAAVATAAVPQIVFIEAGTYRITEPIVFDHYRYVVLRGAGPDSTRLRGDGGDSLFVIWFNSWPSTNWEDTNGHLTDVVGSVPKGATTIDVADAGPIQVGDVVQIDQLDDPGYVYFFDGYYFKRGWDEPNGWIVNGPVSPDGYRSLTETLEVVGKSGNRLTVSAGRRADGSPEPVGTHLAFSAGRHAQVWVAHTTRAGQFNTSAWCGVEDLYVTGGTATPIVINNTSYTWVKHVEVDGNPWRTGIDEPAGGYSGYASYVDAAGRTVRTPNLGNNDAIALEHCFRCEVRDSYVHHTQRVVQGGSSYGVVLGSGSSNNLVENNVVVYFDKCITARTSGGGNVIGYNYVDNAFTAQRGWQEGAIDPCHNTFCHMDLVEGNWAAEMGIESTHGNAGFMTFYRNYSQGRNSGPTPADLLNPPEGQPLPADATEHGNQPAEMVGNLHAFQATAWSRQTTLVGNVLQQSVVIDGEPPFYEYAGGDDNYTKAAPVYRLGDGLWYGGTWDTSHRPPRNVTEDGTPSYRPGDAPYVVAPAFTETALEMTYRHGNWDSVSSAVLWDPGNANHTLVDSLYLAGKPAFFGPRPWPWVVPTAGAGQRVQVLPAKARYDAGRPNDLQEFGAWHNWFAVDPLETPHVGDFDGDGRADIITFTRQNPKAVGDVYVALSDGQRFVDENGVPDSSDKWHDWFAISTDETIVIGDYDGDGRDDIATWLGKTTRQVYVALSLGTGMTRESVWVGSIGFDPTDVILAGDVNADKKADLVCFARRQGKVYVALSNGRAFGTPSEWHGFFAVSTYERPRVADVTGDGRADIVTFATDSPTAQGDVYVAISNGTRFTDASGAPDNSTKWHDWFAVQPTEQIRVGDEDGDGRDDFFTFLPPPFAQCYTVRSTGSGMGPNELWRQSVAPLRTDVPDVGDVNGDGKADIVVFSQEQGKVYVSLAP